MKIGAVRFQALTFLLLMLVCTHISTAMAQSFGVVVQIPLGVTVEGNSSVREPFDTALGLSTRYQQVYDARFFSSFAILNGAPITHLWFRVDTTLGHTFLATLPQIQINFSTTTRPVNGLSMDFQENVGPDDTIVIGPGPITIAGSHVGGGPGPQAFDIHFMLQTPFFYNPANGNLLLDVRNFDGRPTSHFDAHDSALDGVSRVGGALGSNTASFADTIGLVTQFEAAVVPEPGTVCLVILAFAGGVIGFWLSRNSSSPVASTPAGNAIGAPGYRRLFQVGLVVIEENIIELLQDRGLETLPPQGISMGTGVVEINFEKPYLFRQGIIRRNVIRQIAVLREPRLTAISLSNFENALVESNIIDLAKPEPMQHFDCGFVRYFNNRDASGNVLRGNDPFQNRKSPDLARDIEDIMILAL